MPKPRKQLISLELTAYYHCTSRCVRRAFLCGKDSATGKNFEHRRQWIEDRILKQAEIFAISVCSYAVLSDHYHVVLHINKAESLRWSKEEVCLRWHQLYKGTPLTQKFLNHEQLSDAEMKVVDAKLEQWRLQLCSISWFMRALNEPIARWANAEDNCTGKFWEARFHSQALLDEKALAACMAYVDLNPVRAKMANTPEDSDHTSIQIRVKELKKSGGQPKALMPFAGNSSESTIEGMPFRLADYLSLVDWTGRIIREDKRGFISENCPPILTRLSIDPDHWLLLSSRFESRFKSLVGCVGKLKQAAAKLGFLRTPGLSPCQALLN